MTEWARNCGYSRFSANNGDDGGGFGDEDDDGGRVGD